MSRTVASLAGFLALAVGTAAFAEEKAKTKADKLVGVWSLIKSDNPLPEGASATVEFVKDGKLTIKIAVGGQNQAITGTWKRDGDAKLKVTLKKGTEEETESLTIKKLTDEQLVTTDDKGKTDEFKRKADEKKDEK